jgi:hypothetical protein
VLPDCDPRAVSRRICVSSEGWRILEPGAPYAEPVDCGSGVALATARTAAASVGPDFRVVNGQYRFRWRTERSWAGTCYALVLPFTLDGGATVRVLARFA